MKFVSQTLLVHNFSQKNPFLTKPVPIESPEFWLSIGTGFVKSGPFHEKLWTNKVSKTNFMGGSKRMIIVVLLPFNLFVFSNLTKRGFFYRKFYLIYINIIFGVYNSYILLSDFLKFLTKYQYQLNLRCLEYLN